MKMTVEQLRARRLARGMNDPLNRMRALQVDAEPIVEKADSWTQGYRAGLDGLPCDNSNPSAWVFAWHEGFKERNRQAFRRIMESLQ